MPYPKLGPDCPPLKIVEDMPRPALVLEQNTEWRRADAQWAQADKETCENYVFTLARDYGANSKWIAQRFGLPVKYIEQEYGKVIAKAQAELAMIIFNDQLNIALTSTSSTLKQHVGKHFAGQMDNPVISTVDSDNNNVEFEVKLVKVDKKQVQEEA